MGQCLGIFHLQEGFRTQKRFWREIPPTSREYREIAHVMHVEGVKVAAL